MSNTYVKNYDVGQIKLDLPKTDYIHELPLLSFGNIQHTVNLSLVFNSANKTENPFYIAPGFKLNLQKRLILEDDGTPSEYQGADGKYVTLNNCGGVYAFDDESHRVLRLEDRLLLPADPNPKDDIFPAPIHVSYYIVENPDYSKEEFNQYGQLVAVYDKYGTKYLSYTYFNNQLSSIAFGLKYINLAYSNGKLSSITYRANGSNICTTTLNFGDSISTITHYSGVDYTINTQNGYLIDSKDPGASTVNKSLLVKIDNVNNKITITDQDGKSNVYKFHLGSNAKMVDVTDSYGVTTRTQFEGDKAVYSYEIFEEDTDVEETNIYHIYDNFFKDEDENYIYKGTVHFNKDGTSGKQSFNDGIKFNKISNDYSHWKHVFTEPDRIYGNFVVSGWINHRRDTNYRISVIDNAQSKIISTHDLSGLQVKKWNYFSFRTYMRNPHNITVYISANDSSDIFASDIRMTFEEGKIYGTYELNHFTKTDDILIIENPDGGDDNTLLPESDCEFFNDNVKIDLKITTKDILRYKINQMYGTDRNIIFYNDCKGVITNASTLNVKCKETGEIVPATSIAVGTKRLYKDKTYITKTNFYTINGENQLISKSAVNGVEYKKDIYDANLDVKSSTIEGVTTTYARNAQGFVTSESIPGLYRRDIAYADNLITVSEINPEDGATISITKHYIDPTWGVVYKVEVLNENNVVQSRITDTYDADMCALESKTFGSANGNTNLFTYVGGNLETLANDNLKYKMSYDENRLVGVGKWNASDSNYNSIEAHTYAESDGTTTVTSKYPSSTNPLYTTTQVFDKYGRLKSIDGIISNTYDIMPTFNDSTGAFIPKADSASSHLAMSTDLLRSETSRYKYNGNGAIIEETVTDSSNFANKVSAETFTYDDIGRLTVDSFTDHKNGASSVASEITYVDETSSPTADGRVKTYTYKHNGYSKAITYNDYDVFKRITNKEYKIGTGLFNKEIEYDHTRPSRVIDSKVFLNNTTNTLSDVRYDYDAMGRISSINNGEAVTYEYDEYGQLIRENNKILDKTFQYEYNYYNYNEIGNIERINTYAYIPAGTELSGTPVTTAFAYGNTDHPDRLTAYNGGTISYDALGRPIKYGAYTYAWNKDKLSSIQRGSLSQPSVLYEKCSFTYNGYGQRIGKNYVYDNNVASTSDYSYVYDTAYTYDHSGRLIRELITETTTYTGGGTRTKEFVYLYDESGIIGCVFTVNGTANTYYYQRNLLGDVVGIYDTSGNKVVGYAYDAFGNCTITSASNSELALTNPIRYRGYYYDRETKLYYLNSRYYNPQWCRFISPDDTAYLDPESVNGLNLYCYCNNDPINYCDPSGHFAFFLLTALLAVGTVAAIDYIPDQEFNLHWGWYAGSLLGGAAIGTGIAALFAGALGASIGSVATGVGLTYQMLQTVGTAAAGAMLLDNLQNALHYTTHIFWSGGELSQNAGSYLARNVQGITLEMTKLGQYLSKLPEFNRDAWAIASANFANQVKNGGIAFVVQNTAGVNIDSIWTRVEHPILAKKIIELIYVILSGEYYG